MRNDIALMSLVLVEGNPLKLAADTQLSFKL